MASPSQKLTPLLMLIYSGRHYRFREKPITVLNGKPLTFKLLKPTKQFLLIKPFGYITLVYGCLLFSGTKLYGIATENCGTRKIKLLK
jgi:hypothetical protein